MDGPTHHPQESEPAPSSGLLPRMIVVVATLVVGCGVGVFAGWLLFGQGGADGVDDADGYASMTCTVADDMPEEIRGGDLGVDQPVTAALTSLTPLAETAALQDSDYDDLAAHAVDIRNGVMRFDMDGINGALDEVRDECEDLGL